MRNVLFVFLLLFCFLLTACQSNETKEASEPVNSAIDQNTEEEEKEETMGNPTVEDVLTSDQDADIFLFNGIVFQNAQNIEWVNNIELTIGDEAGEIKKQASHPVGFEDLTATKLPVGTKVYKPANFPGPIYLVIVDGVEIPYLGLIEG